MKKSFGLLVLASALLFSGCFSELAVPEKISLKTDAEYSFTVASFDSAKDEKLDMSSMFDLGKLLDGAGTGNSATGFQVYKYNDGTSKSQQYLVNMPLSDIDLNFGETFKKMDFATAFEGMSIEQKFTVPDVKNVDKTEDIPLDEVNHLINNLVIVAGYYSGDSIPIHTYGAFDTLTYKSGVMHIACGRRSSNPNGGIEPDGDIAGKVVLKNTSGVVISQAEIKWGFAQLPLADVTFADGMTIEFSGMSKGYFEFAGTVDYDTGKLKKATGFSIPEDVPVSAEVTIPFKFEGVEDCKIESGSATVSVNFPDPSVVQVFNVKAQGGLDAEFTTNGGSVDLSGKTLDNTKDIVVKADLKLRFTNSTLDFENPPKVNAKVKINTFSATINLGDDYDGSINVDTPVSSDITTFVNSVTWNEIGFKITGKNTLPAGNNIEIQNFKSTFLGLNQPSIEITADPTGNTNINEKVSVTNKTTDFTGADPKIDVSGNIALPGAEPGDESKKIKLKAVEPNETYELTLKIEPILDWKQAEIKSNNANFQGDMNTGLNFSEMFKSLKDMFGTDVGESIQIGSLPLYMYGSFPELTAGYTPSFKGVIKTYYAEEAHPEIPTSKVEYLLGSAGSPADVPGSFALTPIPTFTKNKNDEVTNNFGTPTADIKNLMNAQNVTGKLNVSYDIGLSSTGGSGDTFIVTQDVFNALQSAGDTKISMGIMMVLSVSFDVVKPINLDISNLMKDSDDDNGGPDPTLQERDLFHRESANGSDDIGKYLDLIENISVIVSDLELPVKTSSLKFKVSQQVAGAAEPKIFSETTIGGEGPVTIALNPSEVMNTYPFEPKMEFIIGTGEFSLPREMKTAGKIKFKVKTNGTVDIWENDNGGKN